MKKKLYFTIAHYFRFWAKLQLRRWRPKIVVITGSSGKTSTLHLVEAQLGDEARYSHKANSSFGVPFDILGLGRNKLAKYEWVGLVFKAPLKAFKKSLRQKLYVVEVDCDRPDEGRFLSELLKPTGVIWLSSTQTHAVNFDKQVRTGKFKSTEAAIAYEFGWLVAACREFAIINSDNKNIADQANRTKAGIIKVSQKQITNYLPSLGKTTFEFNKKNVTLPVLVPQEVGVSVLAVEELLQQLDKPAKTFQDYHLPPGRSSVFAGIKNTKLIDSTYNASLDAAIAMLGMFDKLSAKTKWLVISDILEQGENETIVHTQLAEQIAKLKVAKIVTMGPRTAKYTSPKLAELGIDHTSLETPSLLLDYLQQEIKGGETIMFKGTRFMEGVIEHLLLHHADASKLCRREAIWVKRRKAWGL